MTTTTTEPILGGDQRDRVALLRLASAGTFVGCFFGLLTAWLSSTMTSASIVGGVGCVVAATTFALARAQTAAASTAFTVLVTTLVTIVSGIFGNRYAGTASLYLLCVMLAGLLISARAAVVTCAASVVADICLFVLDIKHLLPAVEPTAEKRASAIAVSVVVATAVFTTALRRLRSARDDADKKARELSHMKESLERTVDERTRSLLEAKDAADAGSRAKSAFLANMSHELRTPLNAIVGITGLLRERERPADERELLATVAQSTDALLGVLNDVLDLSRLEAGRLRVERQPCAPRAVVTEVVRLMQPEADRAGLRVAVVIADAVPAQVSTDPARLRQVLLNLIGNAIKFSRAGGDVVVRVDNGGGDVVEFAVEDHGSGIEPELQLRLFEPFVQGDSSSTRRQGGVGLGLAICRQLVVLLGGTIALESTEGKGSTFRFTIVAPVTTTPVPTSAASSAPLPSVPRASSLSVLIVEDNPVNRAVLELMLARLGIQPKSVEGGQQALDWLADHDADVVLLDVQMPEIDGLEVTRRVRASSKKQPRLIAVTAHALPEEEARAREAGVDDYLTKPVRLEVLAEALRRATAATLA